MPTIENGKLFGLGSNDAGASLVCLVASIFLSYSKTAKLQLIFAATAEEEISGENGIESLLQELAKVDFAIIGEPTQMNLAVAEKGLMVLDCTVKGEAGHAARDEGDNAIYKARVGN
jgi:acetylornithine deacetylase